MEDFEFFPDEEEEAAAEEGANRTFIILVAIFGGLLAVGICVFIIWVLVGQNWMQNRIQADNHARETANAETAVAAIAEAETATVTAQPTEEAETPPPTDTPQPPPATEEPTPTEAPATPTATPVEVAGAEATAKPTATLPPAATPKPSSSKDVPDTGVGALGASALAIGLLFLLVIVRRLRRTT
jgi:cytoskeletal protein RodZ